MRKQPARRRRTAVIVEDRMGSAFGVVPVHPPTDFMSVADRLRSALAAAETAPRQTRSVDVDGHPRKMFVLDLSSPALPAGVPGPPALAFSRTEWGLVIVMADNPDVHLSFTRTPIEDLIPYSPLSPGPPPRRE